jgi:rhomboid protease GluP
MADPAPPEAPKPPEPPPASSPPASSDEPTLLARARAAPVTFGLAAVNAIVFLIAERSGSTTQEGTLLRFGAVEPLHVWVGEYWRVATCMFLHIGWIHIAWNTYASIGWSTAIEGVLGKRRFLFLYLASGIGGGCASVVSGLLFGPRISAGASGAMFGIIGATLVLRLRILGSLGAFVADRGVRATLLNIGIWTAIGLTALHMDNAAHLGGLLVGAAVTGLFTSPTPRNGWLAFGATFAALFLVAAHPWWSPTGPAANDVAIYANSYLTGKNPNDPKGPAWPIDRARGVRFAEKGCTHGVALACVVLASEVDPTRALDLRHRACDLDPSLCQPPP